MSDATPTSPATPCPRCQRLLRDLPKNARFCPACGTTLPPQSIPDAPKSTLYERIEQIQSLLHGHLAENAQTPSVEQLHSLMLLGYGNAMLQLGWRYEHGRGVARNAAEAERCYTKSARLGNAYAQRIVGDPPKGEPIPVQSIEGPLTTEPSPTASGE